MTLPGVPNIYSSKNSKVARKQTLSEIKPSKSCLDVWAGTYPVSNAMRYVACNGFA